MTPSSNRRISLNLNVGSRPLWPVALRHSHPAMAGSLASAAQQCRFAAANPRHGWLRLRRYRRHGGVRPRREHLAKENTVSSCWNRGKGKVGTDICRLPQQALTLSFELGLHNVFWHIAIMDIVLLSGYLLARIYRKFRLVSWPSMTVFR